MTVDTTLPSVFDAGLPTLSYDLTATPGEVRSQFQDAQRRAPIAIGPLGPEVLSYEFARAILRDTRFHHTAGHQPGGPGHHLRSPLREGHAHLAVPGGCRASAPSQTGGQGVHAEGDRTTALDHRRGRQRTHRPGGGLGQLRRGRRHRPALSDSDHLRAAGRSSPGLATLLGMGGRHLHGVQLRYRHRATGTCGDARGRNSTATSTTWSRAGGTT